MSETPSAGMKVMYVVWTWLLGMTLVEVLLAYLHVPITIMLVSLLGLSLVKSFLIMSWFMHLRFERRTLVLTLIPAMVACILLMNIFLPDSLRLRAHGVFRDVPQPAASTGTH
jgi:cytochrome c oxidase subunit IV